MSALDPLSRDDPVPHAGSGPDIDELLARMARLKDAIRHYPTPIAGCDDQFNYLCEQRDALAREIARRRHP